MRRRILVAILGTVALALVLSGAGTYLLLRRQAATTTQTNLRAEAEGLADLVALARGSEGGTIRSTRLVRGLQLEGISVVVFTPRGVQRGTLPEGVDAGDLDPALLQQGISQSGQHGRLFWAAAPTAAGRSTAAVVLTRLAENPAPPVAWFLLAGGVALAAGAAVAWTLADQISRPLRAASATTQDLAAGRLDVRLPPPPPTADDEVADLTRAINTMAGSLEHSRGLERQFLLSVSHDLRTPLTSITGYAEAIADGTAPDPIAAAAVIRSEAARLDRLVQDLLDLARLDARTFSLRPLDLVVADVVGEAADAFRPAADAAGVQLTVHDLGQGAVASIDPDRLTQAVANVLENALKYAATTVDVTVHRDHGPEVHITVVDDGPGIDPDDLPHVFERLYTVGRRARRGGAGTGLGLALTAEFLQAMGGSAEVTSPTGTGGGAAVVLRLPALA